jgi:two-component system response regulator FixJ
MKRYAYLVISDPSTASEFSALATHAGFETVSFSSARMFLGLMKDLSPGVVLIDMNLPDQSGLRLLASLVRAERPHVTIGTSEDDNVRVAVEAMRLGAVHFLHRPLNAGELGAALHEAHLKLSAIVGTSDRRAAARTLVNGLTARQREVLRGLISGERNHAMSERLGLSQRTIETYRRNMMIRLGAESLGEAVRIGLDSGMLPLHSDQLAANSVTGQRAGAALMDPEFAAQSDQPVAGP